MPKESAEQKSHLNDDQTPPEVLTAIEHAKKWDKEHFGIEYANIVNHEYFHNLTMDRPYKSKGNDSYSVSLLAKAGLLSKNESAAVEEKPVVAPQKAPAVGK